MTLKLGPGVNIEGWLSHQDRPVADRPLHFGPEDAERVARLGFDHLRINVNEQHLWDDEGRAVARNFDRLEAMLDTCVRLGLKAVFDLHVIRSHHFNAAERPLFDDPACVRRFLDTWRRLSDHLRAWPNDVLAYEFLNEPRADDPEDWNRVSAAVHRLLRDLEPDRTLVLGSNAYSSPGTFGSLAVPDDDNLILTFHFYEPFRLTHHAVRQRDDDAPPVAVHYPGPLIVEEDLAGMSEQQREQMLKDNGPYDRAWLRERMGVAIDVAARRGMPLYCGEWGCYDTVPRPDRLRWLGDMASILNVEGIDWAVYAYRNRWGAVLDRQGRFDAEIVRALLPDRAQA